MRHKRLKIGAMLLFGLGQLGLQSQTMNVKESSETLTTYTLSSIQKISFSSGNLTVTQTNNGSRVYALSDLRCLNYSDITTKSHELLSVHNQMLSVYPNPVSNTLNIVLTGFAQGEGIITIFNFEGKTLKTRQVRNERVLSLDISNMPKGIYLCQYRNAREVKTAKIIKN
jgi:hypothetical protein